MVEEKLVDRQLRRRAEIERIIGEGVWRSGSYAELVRLLKSRGFPHVNSDMVKRDLRGLVQYSVEDLEQWKERVMRMFNNNAAALQRIVDGSRDPKIRIQAINSLGSLLERQSRVMASLARDPPKKKGEGEGGDGVSSLVFGEPEVVDG